jgi:hypothetical protein
MLLVIASGETGPGEMRWADAGTFDARGWDGCSRRPMRTPTEDRFHFRLHAPGERLEAMAARGDYAETTRSGISGKINAEHKLNAAPALGQISRY